MQRLQQEATWVRSVERAIISIHSSLEYSGHFPLFDEASELSELRDHRRAGSLDRRQAPIDAEPSYFPR